MKYLTSRPLHILLLLISLLHLLQGAAMAETQIGILLFSEEARYTDALKGIQDQLLADGFKAPGTVLTVENARANKARGAELVQKFAAAKYDLIFSLGTSTTIPLAREIKDVPIVFSIVYDPVESGIAKDWKSSGNNTTGTYTRIPMALVLQKLKKLGPIQRLAALYTPGEKNSELQVQDLQEAQADFGIKVVPVPLTSKQEVAQMLPEILRTSDALFLTGSNLVNSQTELIVDQANRAKVITITHLEDLVEKGALIGVCANSYKLGRLAGEKGSKVLQGEKPLSLPIETLSTLDVILNMKSVAQGQFEISQEIKELVSRTIQ